MKNAFMLLALLLAVSSLRPQVRTGSAKSWEALGKTKAEATKALVESGSVVESETKNEFLLVPKKPEGSTEKVRTWSFGSKELGPQEALMVQIQVGEYLGKPVFLPLRVAQERGQAEVDDAIKVLAAAMEENSRLFDQFRFQKCSDGRKCVKTCKDDRRRIYCCKYECVKK